MSKFNDRQRARRLRTCRHFTGVQHETCEVGLRYDAVRDEAAPFGKRLPCLDECAKTCAKYEARTAAEVDAEDAHFAASFGRTMTARNAIVASGKQRGPIPCPVCKSGALNFVVNSNGHVHATCSTADCVRWME